MIRKIFALAVLVSIMMMLFQFVTVKPVTKLGKVAHKYVQDGPDELGAANLVTSVVVTYRGLDTLGEVTVLFIATAGVGFLLGRRKEDEEENLEADDTSAKRKASEFVQTGSKFLMPFLFLFGVYIFIHGHLTPGGGFQGGVVIASAVLFAMLANVSYKFNETILEYVESLSGFTYVMIGVFGVILMGATHFLDNRILPIGNLGALFSAGAIPIIYSLVGLKVGSELVGILKNMSQAGEEE